MGKRLRRRIWHEISGLVSLTRPADLLVHAVPAPQGGRGLTSAGVLALLAAFLPSRSSQAATVVLAVIGIVFLVEVPVVIWLMMRRNWPLTATQQAELAAFIDARKRLS